MFDILIVLSIRKGCNIILLKKIAVKMVSFGVKSRIRANLFASTVTVIVPEVVFSLVADGFSDAKE